jgi:hypothetical protein
MPNKQTRPTARRLVVLLSQCLAGYSVCVDTNQRLQHRGPPPPTISAGTGPPVCFCGPLTNSTTPTTTDGPTTSRTSLYSMRVYSMYPIALTCGGGRWLRRLAISPTGFPSVFCASVLNVRAPDGPLSRVGMYCIAFGERTHSTNACRLVVCSVNVRWVTPCVLTRINDSSTEGRRPADELGGAPAHSTPAPVPSPAISSANRARICSCRLSPGIPVLVGR